MSPLPTHQPEADRAEQRRRGRLVVGFSLTLAVLAICFGVIYWLLDSRHGAVAAFAGAGLALATLPILRRTGSSTVSATWLCLNINVVLIAIGWFNGGLGSAAMVWFVVLPVLGVHLAGARVGYLFAAIACIVIGTAYAITASGYVFPLEVGADHAALVATLGLVGLTALLLSVALIYEAQRDSAIREVRVAEQRLRHMHRRYVASARRAGQADVAIRVLHEIGNVLNSANVSTQLVIDRVKATKVAQVARAAALLRSEVQGVGGERLCKLPDYLTALAEALATDHEQIGRELQELQRSIDHIKLVVARQQESANVGGVIEAIDLEQLIEGAVESTRPPGASAEVRRDYGGLALVFLDHDKVRQIVTNLLDNAHEALAEHGGRITVRTRWVGDDSVAIEVEDDGAGIAPADLERIFNLGFSTKADRHGCGLHSSACAATEMGGQLTARSAGVGGGALFTLVLPSRAAVGQRESSVAFARPGVPA